MSVRHGGRFFCLGSLCLACQDEYMFAILYSVVHRSKQYGAVSPLFNPHGLIVSNDYYPMVLIHATGMNLAHLVFD